MTSTPTATQIASLLGDSIKQAQRLLDAIDAEFQALKGSDPGAVNSTLETKLRELGAFEQLENQRQTLFAAADPSTAGIHHALAALDDDLPHQWEQLLRLARECRQRNQTNAAIVEAGRRHVQRALDLLRGSPENSKTYGRKGDTHSASNGHTLAKA